MKIDIELILNKKGNEKNPSQVSTENVTSLDQHKEQKEPLVTAIDKEVLRYLKNLEQREVADIENRIKAVDNNQKINKRTFRLPETEFQNALLRIIYQRNVDPKNVVYQIKNSLQKHRGAEANKMQQEIDSVLRGVVSCYEAAKSLEKNTDGIATNNYADAGHEVDLIAWNLDKGEKDENLIKTLYLVQVKSSISDENVNDIVNTHQQYLDSLPQLIGILNKKEAVATTEKDMDEDVIDIERKESNIEQITLFGLVLDQYISKTPEVENINANDFFQLFKKEGGILNPFTIMGILKNSERMNKYRDEKYFTGDKKAEEYLSKTAEDIKFTNLESKAFHEKHHHTILDSVKIISLVKLGGETVKEIELRHPYKREKPL